VQITYQLTQDDYREAFSAYRHRSTRSRWMFHICRGVAILTICLAILLTLATPVTQFTSLWVIYALALFWIYYVWYCPHLVARKMIKTSPNANVLRTVELTDAGVHERTEHGEYKTDWKTYAGWTENNHVFALLYSAITFVPVPKRAMSPEQETEFRDLLQRHVQPKQ
jgi:hypothetical protein